MPLVALEHFVATQAKCVTREEFPSLSKHVDVYLLYLDLSESELQVSHFYFDFLMYFVSLDELNVIRLINAYFYVFS